MEQRIDAVRFCSLAELRRRLQDPEEIKARLHLGPKKVVSSSLLLIRVIINASCMVYNFAFVDATAGGKYPPLTPSERIMVFIEFGFFCTYFAASVIHYLQFRLLENRANQNQNLGGHNRGTAATGDVAEGEADPFFSGGEGLEICHRARP